MTEERMRAMQDVFRDIRFMAKDIDKAGYSSLDEMGAAYRTLPGVGSGNLYDDNIAVYNTVRKFLTSSSDVKDDEQQLLQEILTKVDNTVIQVLSDGSRVKTLEDLNAFLEQAIPAWEFAVKDGLEIQLPDETKFEPINTNQQNDV